MKQSTKDILLRALAQYQGDDLERARAAFRGLTPEQMQKQYGASGRTCAQILNEYEQHRALVDAARAELEANDLDKWRPIESAPTGADGLFWLTHLGHVAIGTATGDGKAEVGYNGSFVASHWMALPEPPGEEQP